MNLTPEQRKQVRLSLLRYGQAPGGLSLLLATSYLKGEGFRDIDKGQVEAELHYLAGPGKELMVICPSAISPEVKNWETSPAGQDYLAALGL